jgi:hypothetical protein
MAMTREEQLLAEYIRERSEPAFRELVTGHIDLVYSTALRAVKGDSHKRVEKILRSILA